MRKAIFVLVTTVATAAVVAIGTSAFAVAIAPPDEHGEAQDLPAIISGTWSPVEFDVTSTAARGPVVVAGPAAERIGQQAKEEPTTDGDSGVTTGETEGTSDSGAGTSEAGPPETPGGGSGDDAKDAKAEKAKKDKAEKEAKDKADKEAKEAKDKADKEAKDKAAKAAKDKAAKDKAAKDKADKEKKDKAEKEKNDE